MTSTLLRKLAGAVVALAAPALVLATYLPMRDRLPDPMPVHWNVTGEVDGTAALTTFFGVSLVAALVLALGAVASTAFLRPPAAGRMLASVVMFVVWLTASIWVVTAVAAADVTQAVDVALPWYAIAAVILIPAAISVGTFALLPGRWQDSWSMSSADEAGSSSLVLAPGESVVWLDRAQSAMLRVIAALLALAGIAGVIFLPAEAIVGTVIFVVVMVIVAVILACTTQVTVRIDERGVHTFWGPLYWPRSRIPLEQIRAVRVEEIVPMQWGGWGYRVSKRGTAVVIRRGPGLVLSRHGNRPDHAITVPHAAAGAEVLSALLARQRAAR